MPINITTITVLVAGATGDLGHRIVRELLRRDTLVRVLTRPGSGTAQGIFGGEDRVEIHEAAYTDGPGLVSALSGVDTVISAVSGGRPVRIANLTHGAGGTRCDGLEPVWGMAAQRHIRQQLVEGNRALPLQRLRVL